MIRVGSLFSGVGGLDLGLERAGMEVRWQIENDDFCNRVLEKHWPHVKRYGDIQTVDPHGLERVDLICGGFPCQDLSVAGKRAGLAGERSGLFTEFMHVLGAVSPTWVLIENVPGLLSSNGGLDMATVLGALGERGYWWTYRVLDSQYFGVPQRRRRVFIVGHLGGPCPPEILFEPESVYGDTQKGQRTWPNVADTVGTSADRISGAQGQLSPSVTGSVTSSFAKQNANDISHIAPVAHPLTAHHGRNNADETFAVRLAQTSSNGWGISEDLTHTLDETGGDAVLPTWKGEYQGEYFVRPDGISQTLAAQSANAGGGAVNIHYTSQQVRRLTPLECERLQGFPDGWTDIGSDAPRYRALGNAVTVPAAEYIGRRILTHLTPPKTEGRETDGKLHSAS